MFIGGLKTRHSLSLLHEIAPAGCFIFSSLERRATAVPDRQTGTQAGRQRERRQFARAQDSPAHGRTDALTVRKEGR